MTRMKFSIGLLAGLLLGMVAAVVLSGSYATPRALAQAQQPPAAPQRYRISAWSSGPAFHGAYVLDTQSGKVWHIVERGKPELIGTAGAD
jgi:hypothetical protein